MWSVQALAKSVGVERGRHHNYAQVRTDNLLGLKRQGKRYVGGKTALVIFIENHRRHPFECRVGHEHPFENPLGNYLNPGGVADARLEAHSVTDGASHRFAEHCGHAYGNLAGSQTPRLQHQNLLRSFLLRPFENRERQERGLARARRRCHHEAWCPPQRRVHLFGDCRDGQPSEPLRNRFLTFHFHVCKFSHFSPYPPIAPPFPDYTLRTLGTFRNLRTLGSLRSLGTLRTLRSLSTWIQVWIGLMNLLRRQQNGRGRGGLAKKSLNLQFKQLRRFCKRRKCLSKI